MSCRPHHVLPAARADPSTPDHPKDPRPATADRWTGSDHHRRTYPAPLAHSAICVHLRATPPSTRLEATGTPHIASTWAHNAATWTQSAIWPARLSTVPAVPVYNVTVTRLDPRCGRRSVRWRT